MRAYVDANVCSGCGLCTEICGEVFEMDGEVAVVKVDEVPPELAELVVEAAESCPVEAITVEQA